MRYLATTSAQRRRCTRSASTSATRPLTRTARFAATFGSIKRRTRAGKPLSCSSASVEVAVTQGLAGRVTEVAAVRRCAPSDWPQCQGVVTPGTVSVTPLQPMAEESGKSGEGSPYGRREATVGRFSGRKPPRAATGGPEPRREVPRVPAMGLRALVGRSVGGGAQNTALTGPAHQPQGFVGQAPPVPGEVTYPARHAAGVEDQGELAVRHQRLADPPVRAGRGDELAFSKHGEASTLAQHWWSMQRTNLGGCSSRFRGLLG